VLGERLSTGMVSTHQKYKCDTSPRVNGAGTKNYHRPAKTLTDRSLSRSQILHGRDNYANTLARSLAPTCEADDDKTQILTPTALKRDRERKREREGGGEGRRGREEGKGE